MVISSEFNIDDNGLYATITRNGGSSHLDFQNWCITNLQQIDESIWSNELDEEGDIIELVIDMVDGGVQFYLETSFQDAIEAHADRLMLGSAQVERLINVWELIYKPIEEHRYVNMLERILSSIKAKKGDISPNFFDVYGSLISNDAVLEINDDVIITIFTPLLRMRNSRGLDWISAIMENSPQPVFDKRRRSVREFRERVEEALQQLADDATPHIENIAKSIGIQVKNHVADSDQNTE